MVEGVAESSSIDPPVDVALAVILASKSLDSLGAMADALREEAAAPSLMDPGFGAGLRAASEMLRRGTVKVKP